MVSSQTKYVALSMVFEYAFLVFRFLMFKHLGNAYQQGEGMMKIEHCFIYDRDQCKCTQNAFPLQIDSWFFRVLGSLNTHMNNKIAY